METKAIQYLKEAQQLPIKEFAQKYFMENYNQDNSLQSLFKGNLENSLNRLSVSLPQLELNKQIQRIKQSYRINMSGQYSIIDE